MKHVRAWALKGSLTLELNNCPGNWGDIQVKIYLLTQVVLYTKTNGPCATVMWALTNNTTVLFIDTQAHQGGTKQEDKGSRKATYQVRLAPYVRGHLRWCLVSSEGLNLLVAHWQIMYRILIVSYFFCLCHAVWCLLSIIRTIVITDPCVCDCPCDRLV